MLNKIIQLRDDAPEVTLTTYVADEGEYLRDAMLVLPGGGYGVICDDREGEPPALGYMARGVNAFVLKYSVGEKAVFPRPLADASLAMAHIKAHAAEYHIDPERVFCVGFSAGGHLAASLGVLWHLPEVDAMSGLPHGVNRPRGMVLCYAVLTAYSKAHNSSFYNILGTKTPDDDALARYSIEKRVDESTVPAFLMHTADDRVVPVENALYTAEALSAHNIPFELHVYPHAPHGVALGDRQTSRGNADWEDPMIARWLDDSVYWMKHVK